MELTGTTTLLVYANDIVTLGNTRREVVQTTEKLIRSCQEIELMVNENKTKYMAMSPTPSRYDKFKSKVICV